MVVPCKIAGMAHTNEALRDRCLICNPTPTKQKLVRFRRVNGSWLEKFEIEVGLDVDPDDINPGEAKVTIVGTYDPVTWDWVSPWEEPSTIHEIERGSAKW